MIVRLCTALDDKEVDGYEEVLRAVFFADMSPTAFVKIDETDYYRLYTPDYHYVGEEVSHNIDSDGKAE